MKSNATYPTTGPSSRLAQDRPGSAGNCPYEFAQDLADRLMARVQLVMLPF